jgi:DNA-binding MarR family transcriptional regulator
MTQIPRRWLTPDEQKLWRAYLNSYFRLSKKIDTDFECHEGFDALTYEIFVHLSESENHSLRMSHLAKLVSSNKSRLTYRVGELEKKGWLKRVECDQDRRGQWCTLTDEGYDILKKAAPHHVETVLGEFVEKIDPRLTHQMTEALNAIAPETDD